MPSPKAENVARGYKATLKNPNVSNQAKKHAKEELDKYESDQSSSEEETRHTGNVKRGLKAAMHNPNNTDVGKKQARDKLEKMGEHPEQPED
ncbi:hypothetical protein ASPWEDRAFT_174677 [Aspergillus wentii DTO 134E9]|uniref:Conidiation-specific protein 6 n=1 Tax=Aspergillus wentii DTO 134E9 TaxID=1073089 RepID=A0A1L9REB6_ASPWE|nr:uncharacterized protein ASPWEDRAFT_174677 [Aspergillus wentii DTO 134E9]OJJ33261.1 hypothetical protein ASPWEDRAFT_174677 [Aspergillus wentii DTO 134E9]